MSQFSIGDFKPGQRIELLYSKDTYLLLSNKNLANMRNGTTHKHITDVFWDVNQVKQADGMLLAIRQSNGLVCYNPFIHDKDIAQMKLLNKLRTHDELNFMLVKQKIFLNWGMVDYQKIKATKMRLGLVERNFVTCVAQIELAQHNKQCHITKIEIDAGRNLYLYQYDLFENIYTLF